MLSKRFASIVQKKPRVVLDTNALISATLVELGYSAQILRAFRQNQIQLVISPYIVAEYSRVVRRPHITKRYKQVQERADAIVHYSNDRALVVKPETVERVVPDDAKDDAILACAKEGNAQYIVSGDEHLLKLREYKGIKILTPREFVEQVLQAK